MLFELLWGASSGTFSNLSERAFASIEAWRQGPLDGGCPYVFVNGICFKRSWGGSYENVAVPVAGGVDSAGDREVIGCFVGYTESVESWCELFSWLKGRGLSGVQLVTGDECAGMLGALEEVFPGARHRRCTVHFYSNVLGRIPVTTRNTVARMLKAIRARETREACGGRPRGWQTSWSRCGSGWPRGWCVTVSQSHWPTRNFRPITGVRS